MTFTAASMSTAAPTGSTPRPSSSRRTPTSLRTKRIPQLHRYTLGGDLGGPIIKDKLFGFVGYQHLHISDQETGDELLRRAARIELWRNGYQYRPRRGKSD